MQLHMPNLFQEPENARHPATRRCVASKPRSPPTFWQADALTQKQKRRTQQEDDCGKALYGPTEKYRYAGFQQTTAARNKLYASACPPTNSEPTAAVGSFESVRNYGALPTLASRTNIVDAPNAAEDAGAPREAKLKFSGIKSKTPQTNTRKKTKGFQSRQHPKVFPGGPPPQY